MAIPIKSLLIASLLGVGFAVEVAAQPAFSVPNHLAAYYGQNQELIDGLRRGATNPANANRLDAFEQLSVLFPLAASEAAHTLIKDTNLEVAKAATAYLAGTLAMTDHSKSPADTGALHHPHIPSDSEERTRASLQDAIDDNRVEVRSIAASLLATIGDPQGLNRIEAGVAAGRIREEDAVSYFALGPSRTNTPYIARYLDKGTLSAQTRAVGYLANDPAQRPFIKNKIFLNEMAPELVRAAAASALAKIDPQFNTYALPIVSNPGVPTELYKAIISGVLEKAPLADDAQTRALKFSIENFEKIRPDADLSRLKEQFKLRDIIR